MRTTLTLLAMVGLLALTTAPAAAAGVEGPELARPTECLAAFDRSNEDYVGDGWVGNLVSGPPAVDPFTWLFDDTDQEYRLHCGDELTGVVHIAHFEGTGTVHTIDEETEDSFVRCWQRTIGSGEADVNSRTGRTAFTLAIGRGSKAIAIVDTARRFTPTLYTTGDVSNDWSSCWVIRA